MVLTLALESLRTIVLRTWWFSSLLEVDP